MKKSKIQSSDLFPHIFDSKDLSVGSLITETYEDCDIIIVSTSYHKEITGSMAYSFVQNVMLTDGLGIGFIEVPGSFELPLTIKLITEKHKPKLFLACLQCVSAPL